MSLGPWFKCYPSDFLQGMRDMEPVTQAFYVQLILRMYENADAIYADDRQIGRWCNSNARPWKKVREQLIQQGRLVELSDGGLINPRALEEMVSQSDRDNVPAFVKTRLAKVSEMFRESFGKDSRKNCETSPEKPAKTKPLIEAQKPDTTLEAREASPTILEIRSACIKAAGLTDADVSSPAMIAPTEIIHLIRPVSGEPADLELDVIPAIQSCAATLRQKNQTLKSWSYCREAILRNRDNRLSGAPAVQQGRGAPRKPYASASAKRHAQSDADIDAVVNHLRGRVDWQDGNQDDEADRASGGSRGRIVDLEPTEFTWRTGTDC